MAGLYIHIPFCKSRCSYCAFYSTTRLELRRHYVDALCREASLRAYAEPLQSIYLGGGTPSQLSPQQLEQLFSYIYNRYKVEDGAEVTIECNPDDVTAPYARTLARLPVNRISMGAQTFNDQRLRYLNRRHTARQVTQAVSLLRQAGFRNISIDLMYGFPHETLDDWQHDIDTALALRVEHLSAYCLMIEEGTPLYEQMRNEKLEMSSDASDELERQMYELLIDRLEAAGFEHYEISNFAKPSCHSRHNSSYWHDVHYIGLGAAAHSYDGHYRSWNVADLTEYLRRMDLGLPAVEDREPIEGWARYNDRITVALRTREGLDLTTLPSHQRRYCLHEARPFLSGGLLRHADHHLMLTRKGLFVSDMVMAGLINADPAPVIGPQCTK